MILLRLLDKRLRLRCARIILFLALALFLIGQVLPAAPGDSNPGYTVWIPIGKIVITEFGRLRFPQSLGVMAVAACLLLVVLLLLAVPFLISRLSKAPALLWTLRFLAVAPVGYLICKGDFVAFFGGLFLMDSFAYGGMLIYLSYFLQIPGLFLIPTVRPARPFADDPASETIEGGQDPASGRTGE